MTRLVHRQLRLHLAQSLLPSEPKSGPFHHSIFAFWYARSRREKPCSKSVVKVYPDQPELHVEFNISLNFDFFLSCSIRSKLLYLDNPAPPGVIVPASPQLPLIPPSTTLSASCVRLWHGLGDTVNTWLFLIPVETTQPQKSDGIQILDVLRQIPQLVSFFLTPSLSLSYSPPWLPPLP